MLLAMRRKQREVHETSQIKCLLRGFNTFIYLLKCSTCSKPKGTTRVRPNILTLSH